MANSSQPFHLTKEKGIVIGDSKDYRSQLRIICHYGTQREVCSEFEVVTETFSTFWMQNWQIYMNISDIVVHKAELKRDTLGLPKEGAKDILKNLLMEHAKQFNGKFYREAGLPIGEIRERAQYVGGILQNQTLSPYLEDEWLYFGFSLYSDIQELKSKLRK